MLGSELIEAIVLIRVQPGRDMEVLEKVRAVEGVKEALGVTGRFDIAAKTSAPDADALGKLTLEKIRTLEGVLYTETLVAVI